MFRRSRPIPQALLDTGLARAVPRRELVELERQGTEVRLPAGREIMRQDAAGRECLVIIDGTLVVEREGTPVGRLGPGDFVGEMALLNRQLRSASVRAETDVRAYAFSRRDLATVLAACPALRGHVHEVAAGRSLAPAA